jgi:hypothetical protein
MQVLDHVESARHQSREQLLEADQNVLANVTAIIDDDVEVLILLRYLAEKLPVSLVSLSDGDAWSRDVLLVKVEPDYRRSREVCLPHLQ